MRLAISTALLALAAALPPGAAAQWRTAPDAAPAAWTAGPVERAAPPPRAPSVQGGAEGRQGAMLAGGLLGGVLGGLVGLGWGLAADDLGSAYFGTTTGVAAGMAAGVHHGNARQGSLALGLLGSAAWSLVLAGLALEHESVPLLAAAPAGSLVLSMGIEQRTGRGR